jgi:type VI secretion system VgrG family protein
VENMTSKKFSFISNSLPPDTFGVVDFKGSERISTPYRFEVMLVSDNLKIDFDAVMGKTATLTAHVEKGGDTLYHGVVANFEQLHETDGYAFYHARLVPRFWWLSVVQHNQVFLNETVPDFLRAILKSGGLFEGPDFEFRLQGAYEPVEYVCQYGETHLNFLSRWCEHEGIYYYFEQTEDREKVIFTDTKIAHTDPPSGGAVVYSPPSALESSHLGERVMSFHCHRNALPGKVLLKDYNYRRPSLEMVGTADVDKNSRGTVYYYHEHFRTGEEGNRLAGIRAESLKCTGEEYYGESSVPSIAPGYTFTLTKHYRDDFDRKYLTLEVTHEGDQRGLLPVTAAAGSGDRPAYYVNNFTAIPASTQFRSQAITSKPKVSGTIVAKIDAAGSGQYAELDEMGRYKVAIPFDVSGRKNGKASSWIRMAQPYAGSGHGMHFPLHKETEVLLTFVNGDPDRPIIAAAIPNPATASPVTSENQTSNIIHTAGGNKIHMGDQDGSQHMLLHTPTADTRIRIGAGISSPAGAEPNAAAAPSAGSLPPPPEIGAWIDQHKAEIDAYRQAIRQYWVENNPDKVEALKEAKEEWQQTKDGYRKAKEQWQQAEDGYNKAKEQWEQLKEQGGAVYQKAQQEWEQAQLAYQKAQEQWGQAVKAYQKAQEEWQKAKQQGGAAYQRAKEQWEQAEAAYQRAQYQWQQAQLAYQKAKEQWQQAGKNYETAKDNYEKAKDDYGTAKDNYEKAVANYAKAEAGYNAAKKEFEDAKDEAGKEAGIELYTSQFLNVTANSKTEIIFADKNEVVLGGVGDVCLGGRAIISVGAYTDMTFGIKHEYQGPKMLRFKGIHQEVALELKEKQEVYNHTVTGAETRINLATKTECDNIVEAIAEVMGQDYATLNQRIADDNREIAALKLVVAAQTTRIDTLNQNIVTHRIDVLNETARFDQQFLTVARKQEELTQNYRTAVQSIEDVEDSVQRGALLQQQFNIQMLG